MTCRGRGDPGRRGRGGAPSPPDLSLGRCFVLGRPLHFLPPGRRHLPRNPSRESLRPGSGSSLPGRLSSS